MNIGEKIRGLRLLKGLTQENMAHELDISLKAYGTIERGLTDISLTRLEQIGAVLGVSVTDIINFGTTVSNIFSNCTQHNVVTGTWTGNSTQDTHELTHQLEKAHLQNQLLHTRVEKLEMEIEYLKLVRDTKISN